jgi:ribose 5-phosphate isomerase RpiB
VQQRVQGACNVNVNMLVVFFVMIMYYCWEILGAYDSEHQECGILGCDTGLGCFFLFSLF